MHPQLLLGAQVGDLRQRIDHTCRDRSRGRHDGERHAAGRAIDLDRVPKQIDADPVVVAHRDQPHALGSDPQHVGAAAS